MQRVHRGEAGLGVERRLGVVGVEDVAARFPEHRVVVPHGVLAGVGGEREPVLLRRRVGERLGGRAEVLPRPVRRGWVDVRFLEQLLVVDDREVVDQRGDAQHATVDGGGRLRAGEEVVPAEVGLGHAVGEIHDARRVGELRERGAVLVGDVGLLSALQRHGDLLQRVVVGAAEDVVDLDVGVGLVELVDQLFHRVRFVVLDPVALAGFAVAVPQGDLNGFAAAAAGIRGVGGAVLAARARGGDQRHHGEEHEQGSTLHLLPPTHHDSTTDRVRLRGWSGSRPRAVATATAERWIRIELGHGVALGDHDRGAGRSHVVGDRGVGRSQHPDERTGSRQADRPVPVLHGGIGLGVGLRGLAHLQGGLVGQAHRPSVPQEHEMIERGGIHREVGDAGLFTLGRSRR